MWRQDLRETSASTAWLLDGSRVRCNDGIGIAGLQPCFPKLQLGNQTKEGNAKWQPNCSY